MRICSPTPNATVAYTPTIDFNTTPSFGAEIVKFAVYDNNRVAKKLGVHRRMVRQVLASAIAPERKLAVRNKPRLGLMMEFIDEILRADQLAPHKQRHTPT